MDSIERLLVNNTFYTLGNFTLGSGTCGYGPSFDTEEQMEQIVKNVDLQHIYTSLIEYGDVSLKINPTLSAGDVKISLDGGSFSDISTLPTVIGGYKIDVVLSQAETNCSQCQIMFKDQTPIPEWNDKVINISTTEMDYNSITSISSNLVSINGTELSAATLPLKNIVVDNFDGGPAIEANTLGGPALQLTSNSGPGVYIASDGGSGISIMSNNAPGVSLTSFGVAQAPGLYINSQGDGVYINSNTDGISVNSMLGNAFYLSGASDKHDILARELSGTDLTPVTSGVTYLINQIDNPSYGLSAIDYEVSVVNNNVLGTSALVNTINEITSQITISGGNVNTRVADKGVLNDIAASDILGSNIDGMSMEIALAKILAWATGKIDVSGNTLTYYNQDNSTSAFALSGSDTNRIRL